MVMLKKVNLFEGQIGSSTVEYALAGALLVVVLIGGFLSLGDNLNGLYVLLKTDMSAKANQAALVNAQHVAAKNTFQVQSIPLNNLNPPGTACLSNGMCMQTSLTNYNPTQTVGANGINIVDYYANIIKGLANMAHANPNTNSDFAAMLDDLAADGHNVAGDERSVLTYTQASDGGMVFDIPQRYAFTKARAMDYLNAHPSELSPEVTKILQTAANNITQQAQDFIGSGNSHSLSGLSVNQKFTDASGNGKGASYVDQQSFVICGTGGKTCATNKTSP